MNKLTLTLAALAIGSGTLLLSGSEALAYRGDPLVAGPYCTTEQHEAMTKAIENNDYQAWVQLRQGRGRIAQVINEGNFAKFSEMHKLMLEGKMEEANQIRTELGLGLNNGLGQVQQQRSGYGRSANR